MALLRNKNKQDRELIAIETRNIIQNKGHTISDVLKPRGETATAKNTYEENHEYAQKLFTDLQKMLPTQLGAWTLEIDNAKKRAGLCRHGDEIISLSKHFLKKATKKEIYNTISHEVAHAVLPNGMGHGRIWKQTHKALGGNGKRCTEKAMEVQHRYEISCPNGCAVARDHEGNDLQVLPRHRIQKIVYRWKCKCGKYVQVTDLQTGNTTSKNPAEGR